MSTYNLSNDKIPQHIRDIISALQAILGKQFYDFLLIGASARDLIMDGVYDLGISRLTKDVDFAIYVPEWNDYTNVLTKLIASGRFSPTKVTHKLMFEQAYEIDIVPFGEIQDATGLYSWPPDHINAMNVAGFVEINESGLEIQSRDSEVSFRIASIPGICVMKLLAWKDRGQKDNRDGKDIGFILSNYIEMKYEVLYEEHEDIMEDPNFDRITSTARIMGRDIYGLLKKNKTAVAQIKQILKQETDDEEYSRLALAMQQGGIFSHTIAYQSLIAIIKGIADKENS